MLAVRDAQGALVALVDEVADHETHHATRRDGHHELDGIADVSGLASATHAPAARPHRPARRSRQSALIEVRSVGKHFAHHAQGVLLSFTRRNVLLDAAVKERKSYVVVVARGREREQGTQLGGAFPFGARPRAVVLRGRDVRHEHECELTLFQVALHERLAHASGDVPVDRAHGVARHVRANLVELDAQALEHRDVLPGQYVGDLSSGSDLNLANALNDLAGQHASDRLRH